MSRCGIRSGGDDHCGGVAGVLQPRFDLCRRERPRHPVSPGQRRAAHAGRLHGEYEVTHYPLAPQGVFAAIQGEGLLLGLPMVFVRLAGCSIGCAGCDTNYSVASRAAADDIALACVEAAGVCTDWIWLTGGEPTDHDLSPLVDVLHGAGFKVALATAGTRRVQMGSAHGGVDFLSVSLHSMNGWVQRSGCQVNIVPGLNGLRLADVESLLPEIEAGFPVRYVTPLYGEPMTECLAWVKGHYRWRLGIQAHKVWGLP